MGLAVAIAAFAAHIAFSARYGYFRDELYFIECAKHLAWGYVDQPPLVAFCAYLAAPFGYSLTALRFLPSVAAALTVWLAARTAREFGGGTYAQSFTALAVFLLPAYLLLGNTLTTTSFEPFTWTLLLFLAIRLVRTGDPRYWIPIGATFAFGMYGKYSMLLLGASLIAALLVTQQRRVLLTRWFPAGVAVAGLFLLPNVLWQWAHGWPFVQVVSGDFAHRHAFQTGMELEYRNLAQNGAAFLVEQAVYTNPLAAVLWIAGVLFAGFSRRWKTFRFLALAYVVLLALAIGLEAKGYYIIGFYAVGIAAGCTALEQAATLKRLRIAAVAAVSIVAVAFLPLALPVLPVDALIAYSQALHLTAANGTAPRLIQPLYAEEFGWNELASHVAEVYRALPQSVRARTGIFADTYGDAGALSFYGPRYGLPRIISAQNTYYLWGPGDYDGSTLIVVGASQADVVRTLYRKMRLVATYGDSYKWIVEGPTPIFLCSDPIAPLPQLWPHLRWYGA